MIRRKTLNVKEVGLLWYSLTGQKEPAVHTALATVLDFQEEEVEKGNLIESLITEFCFFVDCYIHILNCVTRYVYIVTSKNAFIMQPP